MTCMVMGIPAIRVGLRLVNTRRSMLGTLTDVSRFSFIRPIQFTFKFILDQPIYIIIDNKAKPAFLMPKRERAIEINMCNFLKENFTVGNK